MAVDLNLGPVKPEVACTILEALGYVLSEHTSEISETYLPGPIFKRAVLGWRYEKGTERVTLGWWGYERDGVLTDSNLTLETYNHLPL